MDDRSIVALYLRRDETAIRQTSEKYGRRLRTLAYGIVNDLQTAEECENDTYMEAWNTIPPHEPSDYFYAFLARPRLFDRPDKGVPSVILRPEKAEKYG